MRSRAALALLVWGIVAGGVAVLRADVARADAAGADAAGAEAAGPEAAHAEVAHTDVARAEAPRVYVTAKAAEPGLELEALQIAAEARAALLEAQGFDWEPADVRARGAHSEARAAQQRALRAFRRGRQAYLRLDLEAATRDLTEALGHWEAARAIVDSVELVAETWMYLGASYVLSEQPERAAAAFTRYHVQFGHIAPNPALFNPAVMQAFQSARQKLEAQAASAVDVQVRPASAAVMVDGVPRGRGNVRLEGLRPGPHWVSASGLGTEGKSADVVTLQPGRVSVVKLGEVQDSAELLDLLEHASRPEGARALSQALSVRALAVIEVRRARADEGGRELALTLLGFDGESGREQPALEVVVGDEPSERSRIVRGLIAQWLDRVLVDVLGPTPVAAAGAAAEDESSALIPVDRPSDAADHRAALKRRRWIWASTAASALVAGAVVALVMANSEGAPISKGNQGGTLVLEF